MKNLILIAICIFTGAAISNAQPLNKSTYSTMVTTAEEAVANRDYYNALEWYEKAYDERKSDDLNQAIADLHYQLRDYKKAENAYKRVFRLKKGKEPQVDPNVRFRYARTLKMNALYPEAIEQFQKILNDAAASESLKELAQAELNGAEMAKVLRPIPRLRIENAGSEINTAFSEYSAVLSPDGKEMYFGGFNRKDVIVLDGKEDDYHAKIYKSALAGDKWGKPTVLDEKVNRPDFHTSNVCLSPDGKRMYFTRQQLTGNEVNESKIFFSEQGGEGWSPANEVTGANGNWIAKHPAVGELFGKEVLFFVSDMPGGQGGMDLFYATYKGGGVYGDPVNLGPKLNTVGDEETPFYREGVLYFSSTGHPGIGGFDIFSSAWNGTTWSEPKNMGLGYNTNLDDKYFMIDKEGYKGFLVSNREGTKSTHSKTCCDDIWTVNIEKIDVEVVVGTYDKETGEPLKGSTVQLFELTDNQLIPVDQVTNDANHAFNFPLLLNKSYRLIATRQGYYTDTTTVFNTVGITQSKKLEQLLKLRPIPPEPEFEDVEVSINEPIRLKNIYYDFDDDKILSDAEIDLQVLYDLLTQYKNMKIELSSHTDARGNDDYNANLSQRRAESAKSWLVAKGIVADRIVAKGYGETQILNQCTNGVKCTDEEHRFNRRTEFKIIEGPTTITLKKTEKRQKGVQKTDDPNKSETPKTPAPKTNTPDKKKTSPPGIKRRDD